MPNQGHRLPDSCDKAISRIREISRIYCATSWQAYRKPGSYPFGILIAIIDKMQPAVDITPKRKNLILLTTSLVSSLIMLDSTIVAVSLPAIGKSLGGTFSQLEWVISAYLLTYASLLLGSGSLSDLWGRKKVILSGLFLFGLASAACGLAPSATILNVSRAVQGIGGAMLLTAALAIIANTFQGQGKARAMAVWGAALGVALTLGPILGGAITRYFGWRWIFLVNVPASAALIIAVFAVIDDSRDPNAKKMDWSGILTFSPGLLLLVWALISGNEDGWLSLSVLLRLAGAVVFLGFFIYLEGRQERPMIDLSLFKQRNFTGAVYAMVGYGMAAQVMVFYLPLYLQNAYGFDPLTAGLAMLPFPVPMVLIPKLILHLGNRFSGRQLLTLGLAITALGNAAFWLIADGNATYPVFVLGMLTAGIGAGILNGETVHVLTAAVPPERGGMASGIASTTRLAGMLVGVAGLGAVIAVYQPHTKPGKSVDAQSFVNGFSIASLVAAAVAALAAYLAWRYVAGTGQKHEKSPATLERKACLLVDCRHPL